MKTDMSKDAKEKMLTSASDNNEPQKETNLELLLFF